VLAVDLLPEQITKWVNLTLVITASSGSSSTASSIAGVLTSKIAESETPQDVVDIEVAKDVFLSEFLAEGVGAELIVLFAFLRVAQDGIGLTDLFELLLGALLFGGIAVRVMLEGEFAVGFLDIVYAGAPVDTEYLIVIVGHDVFSNPSGVNATLR
jgi:hypothetical protein